MMIGRLSEDNERLKKQIDDLEKAKVDGINEARKEGDRKVKALDLTMLPDLQNNFSRHLRNEKRRPAKAIVTKKRSTLCETT